MIPNNLPHRSYIQGLWHLDETSGTRYDETDNNNDLTDNNTVGYSSSGKIGNAADFELSNSEYLSITDVAQTGLDITGEITINCWFKPESLGISQALASKWEYKGTGNKFAYRLMALNTNKPMFSVTPDEVTINSATGGTSVSTSAYQMLTGVYDGSYLYVYYNGSSDAEPVSYSSGIADVATPFVIGGALTEGAHSLPADGLIDEVIVWNKALTADEVAIVYNISAYSYFIPQIIMI